MSGLVASSVTAASRALTEATGLWGRRRVHLHNMRAVVMEADTEWDGFTSGEVVGMVVRVTVRNHGAELIRSAVVTMHHRRSGESNSARTIVAIPAQQAAVARLARALGLDGDQPFAEESAGWEREYWFECRFRDLDEKRWILEWSPRDNHLSTRRALG